MSFFVFPGLSFSFVWVISKIKIYRHDLCIYDWNLTISRAGGYNGAPVREGSRACVFLCTSDSVNNINGAYYDNECKRVNKLFKDALDEKQQENLWQLTNELCEKKNVILPEI